MRVGKRDSYRNISRGMNSGSFNKWFDAKSNASDLFTYHSYTYNESITLFAGFNPAAIELKGGYKI